MKKGSFKNKIPNQSINSLNMLLYALDSSILMLLKRSLISAYPNVSFYCLLFYKNCTEKALELRM